jgi:hypothetical protein
MHTLTSSDTLSIRLAGAKATNDCAWRMSYWDAVLATADFAGEGSFYGTTNGVTPVQMLGAPAAGNVDTLKRFG